MVSVVDYRIPRYGAKRILVVVADRWLRSRLESELQRRGCEVVRRAHLWPSDLSELASFDVLLLDATVVSDHDDIESLRAIRLVTPNARWILLLSPSHSPLVQGTQEVGFDAVCQRPSDDETLLELTREALGRPHARSEVVPVPFDLHFVPDSSRPWRRGAEVASAPPVPVAMELRFLERSGEIMGMRRLPSTLTSFVVHILVLAVALLIPLLYTEAIHLSSVTYTWLVAPPPPPPPPPPVTSAAQPAIVRRVTPPRPSLDAKVSLPTSIPRQVGALVDTDVAPLSLASVPDGIVGGVPGGQPRGVLGGVPGGIPGAPPPPIAISRPQTSSKPIRVGAEVRPPRLLKHVQPLYPPNAKAGRLEGSVRIDAIIDTTGRVVEMKVIDGHPLLAAAALEAVRQWVYEPTYLNGQPVPILTEITVHFRLE